MQLTIKHWLENLHTRRMFWSVFILCALIVCLCCSRSSQVYQFNWSEVKINQTLPNGNILTHSLIDSLCSIWHVNIMCSNGTSTSRDAAPDDADSETIAWDSLNWTKLKCKIKWNEILCFSSCVCFVKKSYFYFIDFLLQIVDG